MGRPRALATSRLCGFAKTLPPAGRPVWPLQVMNVVSSAITSALPPIPAIIAGSVLYFLVTPVLAYALTKAVGNTFVMHFESGGTLLNFNPKAFQEYFLKEFKEAGGSVKAAPVAA